MLRMPTNFQKRFLFLEKTQLFLSSNVHKIPAVKKVTLNSLIKQNSGLKELLMCLSSLQLMLGQKGHILVTKKANNNLKTQKGAPVGGKFTLNRNKSFSFLTFLTFNLLPELDFIKPFPSKEKVQEVQVLLKSIQGFKRLSSVYALFQNLQGIQIHIQGTGKSSRKTIFWRLLRLPLISKINQKN